MSSENATCVTSDPKESFAEAVADALDKLQTGEHVEAELVKTVVSRGGVVNRPIEYVVTLEHLRG